MSRLKTYNKLWMIIGAFHILLCSTDFIGFFHMLNVGVHIFYMH